MLVVTGEENLNMLTICINDRGQSIDVQNDKYTKPYLICVMQNQRTFLVYIVLIKRA